MDKQDVAKEFEGMAVTQFKIINDNEVFDKKLTRQSTQL